MNDKWYYINRDIEKLDTEEKKKIANFLKVYCFADEKEVYTNGTILVPMFRVIDALRQNGEEYRQA